MLLGLDTSTSSAGLALVATADTPRTLAEHNWEVGQRHSVELLPRLEALLAGAGARWDELTGVAVATGPGSFNGLRVALSTAKSLNLALGIPLYGVPTLDVAAWGYAYMDRPLWALLEAGRGQLYAARYPAPTPTPDGWAPLDGYHMLTHTELAERVRADGRGAFFCGEWRPETRAALERLLAGTALEFVSPLRLRRGVWLAELALARAARGLQEDPASLDPLYLRRPAITSSAKRGVAPGGDARAASPDTQTEREQGFHALQH